jgi:DnaK suppressor protein
MAKRTKAKDEESAVATETAASEEKPKKKRGRPPKSKSKKTEEPKVVKEPPKVKAPPKKEEEPVKVQPNPDVRYSDDDLADFEKIIKDSKNEAIDELRMLKDRLEDLTSFDSAEESMIYSMHMAEQGSEAMEKEKTYAQIQRINEYLKKLDDALDRIKNKTYGICRVCGILIAKERLKAVPITTLSASYKIHQKCPEDGIDRIEPVKSN